MGSWADAHREFVHATVKRHASKSVAETARESPGQLSRAAWARPTLQWLLPGLWREEARRARARPAVGWARKQLPL